MVDDKYSPPKAKSVWGNSAIDHEVQYSSLFACVPWRVIGNGTCDDANVELRAICENVCVASRKQGHVGPFILFVLTRSLTSRRKFCQILRSRTVNACSIHRSQCCSNGSDHQALSSLNLIIILSA